MIIISGSDSYLSSKLIPLLRNSYQVNAFDDENGSITDPVFIENLFKSVKPEIFINLKEMTDIIKCEFERESCYNTNSFSLKIISDICKKHDVKLIHLSSCHVYGSNDCSMLSENHALSASSVYADSKLLAENFIIDSTANSLIIRSGERFFENGTYLNIISKHLMNDKKVTIPENAIVSPVSASEICSFIKFAVDKSLSGVYNLACSDYMNVYDFSTHYLDLYAGIKKTEIKPEISLTDFQGYLFPTDIPQCCRISLDKIREKGYVPESDILHGMEEYIKTL